MLWKMCKCCEVTRMMSEANLSENQSVKASMQANHYLLVIYWCLPGFKRTWSEEMDSTVILLNLIKIDPESSCPYFSKKKKKKSKKEGKKKRQA